MSVVLITLHDIEPAVRLNAQLEKDGVRTEMVSPLDDVRGILKRTKPEVIVVTGELTDPLTVSIVQEQLWGGAPAIGLAEQHDEKPGAHAPAWAHEKLRALGYVELYVKPVDAVE